MQERHPSQEIGCLNNLIGRYWNANMPEESVASGGNTPILVYLHIHEGEEVFQYDIEREFSVARSTASRVLSLMEKKGLIRRESVQRDARLRRIVLTGEGFKIAQRLKEVAESLEATLYAGMTEEERQAISEGLAKMISNLVATGQVGSAGTADKPPKLVLEEED